MIYSILTVLSLFGTVLTQQKLVCYWYSLLSQPSTIDINTCTHVHYSFVTLDPDKLVIQFSKGGDQPDDFKSLKELRKQNSELKLVAALGGGGDGEDGKYGRMVLNAESRTNFVEMAVKFLNDNEFDGLDWDWEFPACPHTKCDEQHKPEKEGFANVLKEMRIAFNKNNNKLSMSAAVNAGKWLTDMAYDYQTMASALDYINVMNYDNAGAWMQTTGHHSGFNWSTAGMDFWSSTGVPKNKLLMGVPYYGITFKLTDPNQHGIGAPVTGVDKALTYTQICKNVKNSGWTKEMTKDGPIAYKDKDWVSYDDPATAANKAKWVKDNGYGGILIWEVSQDDQKSECCKTDKPMTKALGYGLFGKGADPSTYGCE